MNSFPEDDSRLTEFLQRYRPAPPNAALDLEDRLMAEVESTPSRCEVPRSSQRSRRLTWAFPAAIAASLVAAFVGYRTLTPTSPSDAELAEMQTFIESTWHDSASTQSMNSSTTHSDDELFALPDDSTTN